MTSRASARLLLVLLAVPNISGCVYATDIAKTAVTAAAPIPGVVRSAPRGQRDGRAFPDGVIALTWDDGPDAQTLALAEYLREKKISATFFVVSEWIPGVSADPGFGARVYETGYAHLPLLDDIVALGHRLGNHTMHHALLGSASSAKIALELGANQRAIDPFLRDELRLFRVPGGEWTTSASDAVDGDVYLSQLVGPVRWDVDAKDWEGSVWCESNATSHECERVGGRLRVRADVIAARYLSAIESAGRGIVLMHDRVGDVGSHYAIDIARILIPRLITRGYVFAPPVLAFSTMRERWSRASCAELRLGDVDGDGNRDGCVFESGRVVCAPASWRHDDLGMPQVVFDASAVAGAEVPTGATSYELADVSGDGRADICVQRAGIGIACALSLGTGGFGSFEVWSRSSTLAKATIRFADVDGDGKADACAGTLAGFVCARSTGTRFDREQSWLSPVPRHSSFALGDIDGDGRADVCIGALDGIDCALAGHGGFERLARWSTDCSVRALVLADLNGDGRADICGHAKGGVTCALSKGRSFTALSMWSDKVAPEMTWDFGDVSGDGRGDLCTCDRSGVSCGLAP